MARYIRFMENPGEKFNEHPLYWMTKKRSGDLIGQVFWDTQWQQWCARFKENTIWSQECLRDVRQFIQGLETHVD